MAYLQEIIQTCNKPFCKSRATYRLMSRTNSLHGIFCKKHANIYKTELEKEEKKYNDKIY